MSTPSTVITPSNDRFVSLLGLIYLIYFQRVPLNIEVTPTSGPNPRVFLNVKNLGRSTSFSAFSEVDTHPRGKEFKTREFCIGRESGSVESRQIPNGESASLLIATISPANSHIIATAFIMTSG